MQQAFLIIISVIGVIYAIITKQMKIALGLLVIGLSFVFAIPNIVSGIWIDVFGALTMIVFALGIFILIYKKKVKEAKAPESKPDQDNV